jgi:hypothetical protein
MARRRREQANAGLRAKAAAHEAYRAAIRTGQDLRLAQPSDVTAYGARLMNARRPKPGRQIVRVSPIQDNGVRNQPTPARTCGASGG